MRSLAVIPARGGSKRIPRKNIKNFCGQPIIAYPVALALKSGLFDEVMVSTDDPEIAEIALNLGAKVPFLRSEQTANDTATTADMLYEVLNNYQQSSQLPEYTCCIYPTSPLLSLHHLQHAQEKLMSENLDTIISVQAFSFPIQRAFRVDENNHLTWVNEKYALSRSQDLEKTYHDAGQFYFIRTATFLASRQILQKNTGFIELSELEAQDIDNEADWQLAELKYQLLQK